MNNNNNNNNRKSENKKRSYRKNRFGKQKLGLKNKKSSVGVSTFSSIPTRNGEECETDPSNNNHSLNAFSSIGGDEDDNGEELVNKTKEKDSKSEKRQNKNKNIEKNTKNIVRVVVKENKDHKHNLQHGHINIHI